MGRDGQDTAVNVCLEAVVDVVCNTKSWWNVVENTALDRKTKAILW